MPRLQIRTRAHRSRSRQALEDTLRLLQRALLHNRLLRRSRLMPLCHLSQVPLRRQVSLSAYLVGSSLASMALLMPMPFLVTHRNLRPSSRRGLQRILAQVARPIMAHSSPAHCNNALVRDRSPVLPLLRHQLHSVLSLPRNLL